MSQRYQSFQDSRYEPRNRSRSRSPIRFGERRGSSNFDSQFSHPAYRGPPAGPRGRVSSFIDGSDASSYFNQSRDRVPYKDFDRERRQSAQPSQSIGARSRDVQGSSNNDIASSRGPSRDGSFNPEDSYVTFSGGRGRGRGRGRGGYSSHNDFDSRNRRSFESPRMSPPPPRWQHDDNEFRSAPEPDKWDNREQNWSRPPSVSSRFESNGVEPVARPASPLQTRAPFERNSFDSGNLSMEVRRSSAPRPSTDTTQALDKAETAQSRVRASSPPQAPSVPAFGSLTFKAPPPPLQNSSHVWCAPQIESKKASPPRAVSESRTMPTSLDTNPQAVSSTIPNPALTSAIERIMASAPRTESKSVAPKSTSDASKQDKLPPRAPRAFENSPELAGSAMSTPRVPTTATNSSQVATATPIQALQGSSLFRRASQAQIAQADVSDIRRQAIHGTSLSDKRTHDTRAIPTGPRVPNAAISPVMQSAQAVITAPIPTAPKANRGSSFAPRNERGPTLIGERAAGTTQSRFPPVAPRATSWNQWRAPSLQENIVQIKKEIELKEKEVAPSIPVPSSHDMSVVKPVAQPPEMEQSVASEQQVPSPAIVDDTDEDDDDMDLDDTDLDTTKREFEAKKARLESQLIDLSREEYRPTTVFPELERLCYILKSSLKIEILQSFVVDPPELDVEMQSAPTSNDSEHVPPTPEAEASNDVMVDVIQSDVQSRVGTPEIIDLPFLNANLPSISDIMLEDRDDSKDMVFEYLHNLADKQHNDREDALEQYRIHYRNLKEVKRKVEEARAEREKLENNNIDDAPGEPDYSLLAETPAIEGPRRLHKYGSEYDIQKALEESVEMARREQEKIERDAQRSRDSLEKEAIVPDLLNDISAQRIMFKNVNNLRAPEEMLSIYGFNIASDNFSAEEHGIFLAAYKDRPKKWGEIAALLPGKSYQDCIHHYYAYKWDGRFRETKSKKRKGMARVRGVKVTARVRGAALMADLSRGEDDVTEDNPSSRPKRAAAIKSVEVPAEARAVETNVSTSVTPGRKIVKTGGNINGEKVMKRRKPVQGQNGEKLPRTSKVISNKSRTGPADATPPPPVLIATKAEPDIAPEEVIRQDEIIPLMPIYQPESDVASDVPMAMIEGQERGRSGTTNRSATSSYWSVPEQTDFLRCLAYYGTDFAAIANAMGTKTQTMVKNHFQRDQKDEFTPVAEAANLRIKRGEELGPPPIPTPLVKRRYDTTTTRGRPGGVDAGEGEENVGRMSNSPGLLKAALANTKAGASPAIRPPQPAMPQRGFFTDPSDMTSQMYRPPVAAPMGESQFGHQPDISAAYIQNLVQEREKAIYLQREQDMQFAQTQDNMIQYPRPYTQLDNKPQDRPPRVMDDRSPAILVAPQARHFMHQASQNPGSVHQVLGSPTENNNAWSSAQSRSPVKAAEFRPGSVPGLTQASAVPVVPKTSNIASILNSVSEEPRPRMRPNETGNPFSGQTAQSPIVPRNSTPSNVSEHGRPIYDRPGHSPLVPMAAPQLRYDQSYTRRDEWPNRPPTITQTTSRPASPGQNLTDRDRPGYTVHRNHLGNRVNPSPPPQQTRNVHSRTSPYSTPTLTQPQMSVLNQPHGNIYAQQSPALSSHLNQVQNYSPNLSQFQPSHSRQSPREDVSHWQRPVEKGFDRERDREGDSQYTDRSRDTRHEGYSTTESARSRTASLQQPIMQASSIYNSGNHVPYAGRRALEDRPPPGLVPDAGQWRDYRRPPSERRGGQNDVDRFREEDVRQRDKQMDNRSWTHDQQQHQHSNHPAGAPQSLNYPRRINSPSTLSSSTGSGYTKDYDQRRPMEYNRDQQQTSYSSRPSSTSGPSLYSVASTAQNPAFTGYPSSTNQQQEQQRPQHQQQPPPPPQQQQHQQQQQQYISHPLSAQTSPINTNSLPFTNNNSSRGTTSGYPSWYVQQGNNNNDNNNNNNNNNNNGGGGGNNGNNEQQEYRQRP